MPSKRVPVQLSYEGEEQPSSAPIATVVAASTTQQAADEPSTAGRGLAPVLDLRDFAVLPEDTDNCAILRERLEAGSRVRLFDGGVVTVTTTVLDGHRLAIKPIEKGEYLLSWGLPFGFALEHIVPGIYVVNDRVLDALRLRQIQGLPASPNFDDIILPHTLDEATFTPTEQIPIRPPEERLSFMGFDRSDAQGGVGTRNFIAVVPTSALSGPMSRRLADAMRVPAKAMPNCDGVVALAHTEAALAADAERPKNWDLLLRTLAGFVSHPNAAAVLVIGYENELLTPSVLEAYMKDNARPLPKWCRFLTLSGAFDQDFAMSKDALHPWLEEVNKCERTEQPLAHLRLALQCGGSDAFSGVSGNPACGVASKLLIENGGAAVLAETDELIGAESYIMQRVSNVETARKFLHFVARFKERFSWHGGQSAESNPSGGNKLRGLYNITLKSLGAAKKKHADVSLDGVIDYGERLPEGQRGYYFLDSPGNDLESIAGQVASGCNAIFFVTGNGSVTNFPLVPTIKIITTTDRYRLLEKDMDFNAGRYQDDGVPMNQLGKNLFDQLLGMANGNRSLGERAGHSQVQIWREWAQTGPVEDQSSLSVSDLAGKPLELADDDGAKAEIAAVREAVCEVICKKSERLGLVLPTSLCSGEVARLLSEQLNARQDDGIDRYVALPHTEGCGIGYAGDGDRLFSRILLGHLTHTNVSHALMLEHGCEKNHNAWLQEELRSKGIDASRYGFASVQLDGGIESATAKARDWFATEVKKSEVLSARTSVPLSEFPIAVVGEASCGGGATLAAGLIRAFVGAGSTAIAPANAAMLRSAAFLDEVCGGKTGNRPTLAFAQSPSSPGAHIMDVPKGVFSRVEVVTGLVAAGVSAVVVVSNAVGVARSPPVAGSPMVPVLHIVVDDGVEDAPRNAGDLFLAREPNEDDRTCRVRWLQAAADLVSQSVSMKLRPRAADTQAFQIARGPTGVSA